MTATPSPAPSPSVPAVAGTTTVIVQTPKPTPAHDSVSVPAALLGSTVVAALLTAAITAMRASAGARRDRYADATGHLAALTEFPYRIRRRTSDDAATLTALADVGHDLQQASACHRGWIAGESRAVAAVYDAWLREIQRRSTDPLREAWEAPKVTKPEGMNLNGFGPGSAHDAICAVEAAIGYRFGWRRALPWWVVAWRIRQRNLLPPAPAP